MKSKYILLVLAIASVASSCIKEVNSEQNIVTFRAFCPDTKTQLASNGSIYWKPGDVISIFYQGKSYKFTSTNTSVSDYAEFKGSMDGLSRDLSKYIVGVYPYSDSNTCTTDGSGLCVTLPSNQSSLAGTFADDLFPSVARTKDNNLHFYNICGGIKFSIGIDGVKKIVFRGNNNETVAGRFNVVFPYTEEIPDVSSIVQSQTSVTLTAPGGGTFRQGDFYYLALIPQEFKKGYTIEFYSDKLIGKKQSDKTVTVRRAVWGVLNNIKPEDNEPDPNVSISFSSEQLSFFSVAGDNASQTLTIKNTGTSQITVNSIVCDSPFYCYTGAVSIAANKSKDFTISFSPGGVSAYAGKARITINGSKSFEISLQGRAYGYGSHKGDGFFDVTVSLDSHCEYKSDAGYLEVFCDYGSVPINESEYFYFHAENKGMTNIRVIATGYGGAFYDYDPSWDITHSYEVEYKDKDEVLQPGRGAELSVYFCPTSYGSFTGKITLLIVDESDPDNYFAIPVYLQGSCEEGPLISFNPEELYYGQLIMNLETKYLDFSVWSRTDVDVPVSIECPEGFIINESQFTLVPGTSDFSKKLRVIFKPTQAKDYSGALVIHAAHQTFELKITAYGVGIGSGFVDFGLDVLWSGRNLGADSILDYGDFYAWGETIPNKESYTYENYLLYKSDKYKYSSYLDPEDDAAYQANSSWRMPTNGDWNDLDNATNKQVIKINGVTGLLFMGNKEGYRHNSIFFPLSGQKSGNNIINRESEGYYWSSYTSQYNGYWMHMTSSSSYPGLGNSDKYKGASLRPVKAR